MSKNPGAGKIFVIALILTGLGVLYYSKSDVVYLYHFLIGDAIRELLKHFLMELIEHMHFA